MQVNPTALTQSSTVTFTPDNPNIFLDWGGFGQLGDVIFGDFGIFVPSGVTAGVSVVLGTLSASLSTNASIPVCNSYGSSEYIGNVIIIAGQLTLVPAITKAGDMRICGVIIGKTA